MTTYQETCGPTETPDDIDIHALREKYPHERDKRLRAEGIDAVSGAQGRVCRLLRDRSVHAGDVPRPDLTRTSMSSFSEVVSRVCLLGPTSRRPVSKVSGSSKWPATSAVSGTGTDSPAFSATTTRTATSRSSRNSTSCRRRSSPTEPRSSSIAATSESISACTTARCSPPRCASCAGTSRSSAGGSARTAAMTSGLDSWC